MAKSSTYQCQSCNHTSPKWLGQCPNCKAWASLEEVTTPGAGSNGKAAGIRTALTAGTVTSHARRITAIDTAAHKHSPTGIGELDRTLGGGLVAGQVVLIAGEPGVGKSTLLLAAANSMAEREHTVLYVSGEESAEQITLRAQRMNITANDLFLADETDLSTILGHIEEHDPGLVIIDSIQTVASPTLEGRAGGVAQVHECATVLTRVAKGRGTPIIIVGQVTKDGSIAGPNALNHLVDTVLEFDGDKHTSLRLLRTIKNRFGPADEVSCWEQTEDGIREVPDPSGLFLSRRATPVAGTAVTVTMEGRRPLLAEAQALIVSTNAPNPRRGVSGLDSARMNMLLAVTERHGRIRLYDKDTFLATVAGMRITEPAADLAVILAVASAAWEQPVPLDVVVIGEVTLSGDVRPVPNMRQRLTEAGRLGYTRAIVPPGTHDPTGISMALIRAPHVDHAFAALRAMQPDEPATPPEKAPWDEP